MKKLLLVLLALPFIGFGQFTYVPDNNFESYLEANGMGNGMPNDDYVNTANINTITSLDVSYQNIADLTGIEDFTALTHLYCYNNQLTSLNLSQNTALTVLDCYNNQLTSLDVSQNTALTYLDCRYNQLTSLNVNQNTALTYLECYNNQLTSLDVSQNTALIELGCGNNQLTSLDVSQNTALTYLWCGYNQLTSLNVSQNTALTLLYCSSNQLTSLDVSQNTALTYLWCGYNQLTSLNLNQNTALTDLYCEYNQLTSLDVRNGNNTNFTDFYAFGNPNLYCIDVDDATWSTANWTIANQNIDPQSYFSNNCSGVTPTWNCNNGVCSDPGTGTGAYTSLTACQANCVVVTPTWECYPALGCYDPGNGMGTYASLADCYFACGGGTPSSWDCNNGVCSDPGTGTGAYASLTACQAACGATTDVPVDVYIINPNGCPYTIAETWGNPILGAGNATWVSTDSLTGQDLLHFLVPDTNNQTLFTICAVPAPPCNCPPSCSGPISIFPNMAITLVLCQPSDIDAIQTTNSRKVLKITDLLGRATKATNQLLFYIYDDGTVEKKVIIE